jgi:hypothetical protein
MRWYSYSLSGGQSYSWTENGITAVRTNTGIGNPDIRNYDDPNVIGHGSLFIPLKLEGSLATTAVPEPSALWLIACGIVAITAMMRISGNRCRASRGPALKSGKA